MSDHIKFVKAVRDLENGVRIEEAERFKDHLEYLEGDQRVRLNKRDEHSTYEQIQGKLEILNDLILYCERWIDEKKALLK